MLSKDFASARRTVRVWAFAGLAVALLAAAVASGCVDRPLCDKDCRPKTTNVLVDRLEQRSVDKIDLLFMIDNSVSMADKQEILRKAVPKLVGRLVNPTCVNPSDPADRIQATSPQADCPGEQYVREFQPIEDIHIGVISSSLGSYGADTCPIVGKSADEQNDDRAHLIGSRPRAQSLTLSDKHPAGFLDWDTRANPSQSLESFSDQFGQLVQKVGESGCGYEASLEAWYRFLVDPNPYKEVRSVPCPQSPEYPCAQPDGRDDELLAQRAAFLRPDSLVAVIMLTDENDCSLRSTSQYFYPARGGISLPRATSVCAEDPNSRCCHSCEPAAPEGCPSTDSDPACLQDKHVPVPEDHPNLRCWNQRQRFGIDFLFPFQRYVRALSSPMICPSRADLDPAECESPMPNPLYVNPNGVARSSDLVFLAGIVGVPWQLIRSTTDDEGNPLPENVLRFKTAAEMAAPGDDTWSKILGDPKGAPYVSPADPHMLESVAPRTTLAGPESASGADEFNGHEWNIVDRDDLQYACTFPLQESVDCLNLPVGREGCDCGEIQNDVQAEMNPLCQSAAGSYGNEQYSAKAYPGIRHLQVIKGHGDNGIVASICPKEPLNESSPDFGYGPAVDTIVDRLKEALAGKCLPRELTVNEFGEVPCVVIEAKPQPNAGCNEAGRMPADAKVHDSAFDRLEGLHLCGDGTNLACDLQSWTLCTIEESKHDGDGDGRPDCLQEKASYPESGWCYVDPSKGRGDASLVSRCDPTEKRLMHFVRAQGDPDQVPLNGATVLYACLGAEIQDEEGTGGNAAASP